MPDLRGVFLVAGATTLAPGAVLAQDASTPGEVTSPHPTLENLSLEWALGGDDDLDAEVTVAYRAAGEVEFHEGLPLFRVPSGSNEGFDWTNKFAGSLFGLTPGTTYEITLSLRDPDGGDTTTMLEATTRAVPGIPTDATEVFATPATLSGALDEAGPGTVLTLEGGTYGEIVVSNDGSAESPLVIRALPDAVVIVAGDVRIDGRSHVLVDGLLVQGKFKFNDAAFITVQNCTIEAIDDGIVSYGSGVENAVITNNVIIGPTVWREEALGVDGDNLGEGVVLTGAGNVVSFNRVSGFRDCLSLLEDGEANNQVSNDFYGNDLSQCADDAIEADFAMGNVRVYQNRISDSFMGLSSQPSLGGPTYFVRNVMYDVLFQAFKLQRSSVGDVGLHNTVVKSGDAFSVNTSDVFSRAWFRNNLFIGGPGGTYLGYDSGPGEVIQLPSADETCSFDYDGYGSIETGTFQGRIGDTRFESLEELQSTTSEVHAIEVDLDVFAEAVPFPTDPFGASAVPRFDLAEDAAARDRGTPLPNVNDGFGGTAPDLGAIEYGAAAPEYGPGGDLGEGPVDDPEPNAGAGGESGEAGTAGAGASSAPGGAAGESGTDDGTFGDDDNTADDDTADDDTADDDTADDDEAPEPDDGSDVEPDAIDPLADGGAPGGDEITTSDSGCDCRLHAPPTSSNWLALGFALAVWFVRRRGTQGPFSTV